MDKFGLPEKTINILNEFFRNYPKIQKVIIFGSRANGTYKNSSDIDFAIIGENIDFKFISHISAELDELSTPYIYDVLDYKTETNQNLRENIDRFGKVFYEKQDTSRLF